MGRVEDIQPAPSFLRCPGRWLERNKVHLANFHDDRVASVPKDDSKEDIYFYDHSAARDTLDWSNDVDHVARVIASLADASDPHITDLIAWLELDRGDHASREIGANIDHAAARAALRSGELAERLRSDREVMQAYLDAVTENPQVRDAVAMWAREGHSEETKRLRDQLNQELELKRSTGIAHIAEQLESWRAEEFAKVEAEAGQREKFCFAQQEARSKESEVAHLERIQALEAEFDRRRGALELAAAQQTKELDIVRAETEAAKATLELIKSDEAKAHERLTAVNAEVDRQLVIASRLDVSSTSSKAAIVLPTAGVTHTFREQPKVSLAAKGALIAKQALLTEHGKQLMRQLTILMLAGELPLLTGEGAGDLLRIAEALLCPGRSASVEADPTIISIEDLWSRPGSGAPTALAAAASAVVGGGATLVVIRGAERSAARVWYPALADALRSGALPRGLLVACVVNDLDHEEIKALPRDTHLIAAEGGLIDGAYLVGPSLLSPPKFELAALDPGDAPVDLFEAELLLTTLGFKMPLHLGLRVARIFLEGLMLLGDEGAAQSMVKDLARAMGDRAGLRVP